MTLPATVDAIRAADRELVLDERMPVTRFLRFTSCLADGSGEVRAHMAFGRDERGARCLQVILQAEVMLMCQRCLDSMRYPVNIENRFTLLMDEAASEELAEGEDWLLVTEEGLSLREVLEDELILSLPIVPRHAIGDSECRGVETVLDTEVYAGPEKENPFAVLAALKKDSPASE